MAAGLIVRDVPRRPSAGAATSRCRDCLQQRGVVAIAGIDTRKLTRMLRDSGAQNGALMAGDAIDVDARDRGRAQVPRPEGHGPGEGGQRRASRIRGTKAAGPGRDAFVRAPARYNVVAYDFGIKLNILRMLAERGCDITVVPAQTPAAEVLAMKPDGVFLSNGPGDPEPCDYAIAATREFLARKLPTVRHLPRPPAARPRASARKTLKMKFGHHGANHPVIDLDTGRVLITSQNHGFAVDEATLPATCASPTARCSTAATGDRIDRRAGVLLPGPSRRRRPGPHDVGYLFDRFIATACQSHGGAPTCQSAPTSRPS